MIEASFPYNIIFEYNIGILTTKIGSIGEDYHFTTTLALVWNMSKDNHHGLQ